MAAAPAIRVRPPVPLPLERRGPVVFWGRLPIVGLGAALASAVFLWTRSRFGIAPAAIALFLGVLSPELLADGQIVTTDLAISLFMFLSSSLSAP